MAVKRGCFTCKHNGNSLYCPPNREGRGSCNDINSYYKWEPPGGKTQEFKVGDTVRYKIGGMCPEKRVLQEKYLSEKDAWLFTNGEWSYEDRLELVKKGTAEKHTCRNCSKLITTKECKADGHFPGDEVNYEHNCNEWYSNKGGVENICTNCKHFRGQNEVCDSGNSVAEHLTELCNKFEKTAILREWGPLGHIMPGGIVPVGMDTGFVTLDGTFDLGPNIEIYRAEGKTPSKTLNIPRLLKKKRIKLNQNS